MKKILLAIICVFLLTGCTDMMNTPTKRVEEFLGKYQTMDDEIMTQLNSIVEQEGTMTDKQKKEYEDLMKKQYQNLSYKIKDETVDDDHATVEVEIEVFDYHTASTKADSYLEENKDKFLKAVEDAKDKVEDGIEDAKDKVEETIDQENDNDIVGNDDSNKSTDTKTTDEIDQEKFMDYKIEQLKNVKDKVKYTLTFSLTKKDNKWTLDNISEVDRLKIHGLYDE